MQTTNLEELELRMAYIDDTLNQLSDTVYAQSRALERLAQRCQQLESRIETLSEGDGAEPVDQTPPHY
jgi:SlyX protein